MATADMKAAFSNLWAEQLAAFRGQEHDVQRHPRSKRRKLNNSSSSSSAADAAPEKKKKKANAEKKTTTKTSAPDSQVAPKDTDDTTVYCYCEDAKSVPAVQRTVGQQQNARYGQAFWCCSKGRPAAGGCGLMQWVNDAESVRCKCPGGKRLSPSTVRPDNPKGNAGKRYYHCRHCKFYRPIGNWRSSTTDTRTDDDDGT